MGPEIGKKKKLSRRDLVEYFHLGGKLEPDFKVGIEWEKIGVYRETAKAIQYSGPKGVEAILRSLSQKYGWEPVLNGEHIIALHKGDASITLEPGGQIELSGEKALFLDQNTAEFKQHLKELKDVSEPMGIAWLGLGLQPMSSLSEIEWVPKNRYAIMRENLKGSMAHNMMKQTASIQISIDYENERDAMRKLRLAMGLGPIFNAIFANSPIQDGAFTGFMSKRAHIWMNTAPERSGLIPGVFDESFNFESYVEYALSLPVLFIVRNDRWISTKELTFRAFMENGFDGIQPTAEDWHLHLTTIFTDSRLKKYLEIRVFDCQKADLGFAAPALVKGIFYDRQAREAAWEIVADLSLEARRELTLDAAQNGLRARLDKESLFRVASKLVYLAEEGLERLKDKKLASDAECRYLVPLKDLINKGQVPADHVLGCFESRLSEKEKIQRIISCAAI